MNERISLVVGAVLVLITAICCATYYEHHKTEAMKSNIESAIVKGIDPIAVRCAYERSDNVCIAYSISHGKTESAKK